MRMDLVSFDVLAAVDIYLGDGVEAAEQPHQHVAGCNPILDAS
jgi:hypothetical protein